MQESPQQKNEKKVNDIGKEITRKLIIKKENLNEIIQFVLHNFGVQNGFHFIFRAFIKLIRKKISRKNI